MSSDPLTEDTKEGNVPKLHHDRTKQTEILSYFISIRSYDVDPLEGQRFANDRSTHGSSFY
jgi:hypothetical protein